MVQGVHGLNLFDEVLKGSRLGKRVLLQDLGGHREEGAVGGAPFAAAYHAKRPIAELAEQPPLVVTCGNVLVLKQFNNNVVRQNRFN